jgi:molybdopterin molybdotransferase
MISLEEARALIRSITRALPPVATPFGDAGGRVLREAIVSPEDLPAFDRSAMDGYAIVADDPSERFRVVAEIPAGIVSSVALASGECARVFTGARIPAGASQVLMQEYVKREGEWMIPQRRDGPRHIRQRGEDAARGAVLLAEGTRLRACELALLAHVGALHPRITPAPRVVHLVTGGELVAPEETPANGQIRDTNSALVAALLRERGAQLVHQERCGDDLALIVARVRALTENAWDVLLLSGGASVGDYDFGARALRELGFTIHFDRLNLRPGKPLLFGSRGTQLAFVLPGNPVSHFVTFHLAVRLALECLEGAPPSWPLAEIEMEQELPAQADPRETYWPATVRSADGRLLATPRGWKSSGDLCGLATANALFQLLPGSGPLARGARAKCLLLDLA